jgi:hypothetical protein
MSPSFFAYFFWRGSHIYAQAGIDWNPSIYYIFCAAGMTGGNHHAQLFIGWDGGLVNFLPGLVSNRNPTGLCLLSSWWDYSWITGLACSLLTFKNLKNIFRNIDTMSMANIFFLPVLTFVFGFFFPFETESCYILQAALTLLPQPPECGFIGIYHVLCLLTLIFL